MNLNSGLIKIREVLEEKNIKCAFIPLETKTLLVKRWYHKFAPGCNINEEPGWHAFSFRRTFHLAEQHAVEAFHQLYFKEYTIFSSNPKFTGLACTGNQALDADKLQTIRNEHPELFDLYISHSNFKWTFVITHESDFGPYFCSDELLKAEGK